MYFIETILFDNWDHTDSTMTDSERQDLRTISEGKTLKTIICLRFINYKAFIFINYYNM